MEGPLSTGPTLSSFDVIGKKIWIYCSKQGLKRERPVFPFCQSLHMFSKQNNTIGCLIAQTKATIKTYTGGDSDICNIKTSQDRKWLPQIHLIGCWRCQVVLNKRLLSEIVLLIRIGVVEFCHNLSC